MTAALRTLPVAAAELGVSVSWLQKEVAARAVPHTRLGRSVRFSDQNLADIVAAAQVRPVVSQLRRRSA